MIKTSVRGIEELKALFKRVPVEIRRIAVEVASEYLIGDSTHGLKHMVKYKYVSRKAAYGQTFSSDKQRRYVMAMIRSGEITPGRENRTWEMVAGWKYTKQGGGYGATIYNKVKGAKWVYGDDTQAKQIGMVGHRKISDVIKTNIRGAMQAVNRYVEKWIKQNNK